MEGKTHIVGGVALASSISLYTGMYLPESNQLSDFIVYTTFLMSAISGAIFPDIDKKDTTISNKHPVVSFFLRLFLEHRGFTHSLLCLISFAIIFYPIVFKLSFYPIFVLTGFEVGLGSHILLDSFNEKGVPLFYPNKTMVSFAKIKTGGFIEFILRWLLIIYTGYIMINSFHDNINQAFSIFK